MSEPVKLLKDAAGYTDNEIAEKFVITENPTEYIIKAIDYLDAKTFKAIAQAVGEKGGGYIPGKTATFTIPKTQSAHGMDSEVVYKESRNEIQTVPLNALLPPTFRVRVKPETELSELVESVKTYGVLEPIIVRPKGDVYEIIAGDRRVKAAKTAGLTEISVIIKGLSDFDAFTIQLSENLHRKDLTPEEKSMALADYAKRFNLNPQQIADKLKMSYRWVCLYLPEDFKDKEMVELGRRGGEATVGARLAPNRESQDFKDQEKARAGALGGEARSLTLQHSATSLVAKPQDSTVTTPTQPQEPITPPTDITKDYMFGPRQCEKCGGKEERDKMSFIDNLLICRKCAGKDKPLTPRKLEQEPTFKPKEKADFRVAQMQPQKSKQELDLLTELAARNITPETDTPIPLWITTPDGIYAEKKLVYYVHGEVHDKGKALERDDEIVAALERQGWTVFVFRHGEGTVKEWADKIEEFLRW